MAGWPHQLNGHEFEQALKDREGQGSLVCTVHGVEKSDTTRRLNNNKHTIPSGEQSCVRGVSRAGCILRKTLGSLSANGWDSGPCLLAVWPWISQHEHLLAVE